MGGVGDAGASNPTSWPDEPSDGAAHCRRQGAGARAAGQAIPERQPSLTMAVEDGVSNTWCVSRMLGVQSLHNTFEHRCRHVSTPVVGPKDRAHVRRWTTCGGLPPWPGGLRPATLQPAMGSALGRASGSGHRAAEASRRRAHPCRREVDRLRNRNLLRQRPLPRLSRRRHCHLRRPCGPSRGSAWSSETGGPLQRAVGWRRSTRHPKATANPSASSGSQGSRHRAHGRSHACLRASASSNTSSCPSRQGAPRCALSRRRPIRRSSAGTG